MTVKAIVLDRDGVLIYFDMKAIMAFMNSFFPLSFDELAARWMKLGKTVGYPGTTTEEQGFFNEFWKQLGAEFQLSEAQQRQLQQLDYATMLRAYPDVRPALFAAKQRGLKIGVLSNFRLASLNHSLQATGLADLIDAACAAVVIGAAKPDAAAYHAIAHALAVKTDECLLFDDRPSHVEGARAVGMQAYLVDRRRPHHDLANGVVCDLSVLPEILQTPPATD